MRRVLTFILFFIFCLVTQAQDNRANAADFNKKANQAFNIVHSNSNRDSLTIYQAVINGVDYSLKSDEYDRMPNRKGKVKPEFEDDNAIRVATLYPMLIDAGLFLMKSNYTTQDGIKAWELYLTARNNPLVADIADESGIAAYYLAYNYLKSRNFRLADKYADLAMQYDETVQSAVEVKAACMREQMKTAEDSMQYLAVLEKLYETEPTNQKYFSWIMSFYQHPTQRFNIERFIDHLLMNDAKSAVSWILKGEIAMQAGRWEEAIEAYKMADEISPELIPIPFNIGVCLNMKGIEMRNEVLEKKKKGELASDNEFMSYFAEARNYLERVKAKDPRRNKVDWVNPLYMAYNILGNTIKAQELESLINK